MTHLWARSALELVEELRSKRISPVELMESMLGRIDSMNAKINAIVSLDAEAALCRARSLMQHSSDTPHHAPLFGLPVVIKDLDDAAGFPNTYGGLKPFATRVSQVDAIIVERLKRAGAIVIGKSNAPPFGAATWTDNELFGATRNPWNLLHTPGGSSGGAAAAVASGMVPLASASDRGGSTRIPAAYTGLPGLKPTRGVIPMDGSASEWSRSACLTPMARSVADTALMLDVLAGPDPRDPFSVPRVVGSYSQRLASPPGRMRVGAGTTLGVACPTDEVRGALEAAAEVLQAAGFEVAFDDFSLPHRDRYRDAVRLRQQINGMVALSTLHREYEANRDSLPPTFTTSIDRAYELEPGDFHQYWTFREAINQWAAELFERFDLLLMPTTPTEAPPISDLTLEDVHHTIAYTAVFNDSGHPAMSVPVGFTRTGMPLGVQLVGPLYGDELVLRVAWMIEERLARAAPPRTPGDVQGGTATKTADEGDDR